VLVTSAFWPLATMVASSLQVDEKSLVQLPVASINSDYGTEEDLRALSRDAADEILRRFRGAG
jgi:hypothetical protein